jgi:hypothetical protein
LRNGKPVYYSLSSALDLINKKNVRVTEEHDLVLHAPSRLLAESTPKQQDNFIFTFNTADTLWASYDGEVQVTLFASNGLTQDTIYLPSTSFKRGKSYIFPFKINPYFEDNLARLMLMGEKNFFNDHWTVDTVTAWSIRKRILYTFDIKGDVANLGDREIKSFPYKSKSQQSQAPTTITTIYIWSYRALKEAVGHTSMTLSDGTHISWWPSNTEVKQMPLGQLKYSAVGYPVKSLEEDIKYEEGHAPDHAICLGNLNEDAIRTWWQTNYVNKDPKPKWEVSGQNCAKTVRDALEKGGALDRLTAIEKTFDSDILVYWTPNDILNLATLLQTRGYSIPDSDYNSDQKQKDEF